MKSFVSHCVLNHSICIHILILKTSNIPWLIITTPNHKRPWNGNTSPPTPIFYFLFAYLFPIFCFLYLFPIQFLYHFISFPFIYRVRIYISCQFISPKDQWSEGSIVRRVNSQKDQWSEGLIVRRVDSPKGPSKIEFWTTSRLQIYVSI